jgi:hypothetical protein
MCLAELFIGEATGYETPRSGTQKIARQGPTDHQSVTPDTESLASTFLQLIRIR